MEELSFNTTQNVDILSDKAGVGDRFIAGLIDYTILAGITLLLILLSSTGSNVNIFFYLILVFIGILFFFYHFFCEVLMDGQSIGKKYRKIKVMHQSGRNAGIGQFFIRALIRPIDLLFGLIFIAFTPKSQRIGDLAAATIVVKLKEDVEMDQLAFTDLDQNYQPIYPRLNVNKLKPSDIELIKEILTRSKKTLDYALVIPLFEKTKSITGLEPETKPVVFLNDLIKDYNHYNS